jgi:hypothetical protein
MIIVDEIISDPKLYTCKTMIDNRAHEKGGPDTKLFQISVWDTMTGQTRTPLLFTTEKGHTDVTSEAAGTHRSTSL